MKKLLLLITFFICAFSVFAGSKNVQKSFYVDKSIYIKTESISGMKVKISSWDKNEIKFDLKLNFTSSDKDFEREFINKFDIVKSEDNGSAVFKITRTDAESSWSLKDLFKLQFSVEENISVEGEIIVPVNLALATNFNYGRIEFKNIVKTLDMSGTGNTFTLENCNDIHEISNNYGNITLTNCGGNTFLESRSNTIKADKFKGNLNIDSDYSNITVRDISGNAEIFSRSANIEIYSVTGEVDVNSEYSNISVFNSGFVKNVETRSGNITISETPVKKLVTSYTNITLSNMNDIPGNLLHVINQSGSIKLDNITSNIQIDDSYSEISLNDINGNIELRTRSNNIKGMNIKGNWDSRTEYTSIKLDNLEAENISIRNKSNPVVLDLTKIPNDLSIDTEYGEANVEMPAGYNGRVVLETKYGKIKTNLPLKISQSSNTESVNQSVGNSGNRITINNRSGNIKLTSR